MMQINAYTKFKSKHSVIICLYVDDLLIFGIDMKGIIDTKK